MGEGEMRRAELPRCRAAELPSCRGNGSVCAYVFLINRCSTHSLAICIALCRSVAPAPPPAALPKRFSRRYALTPGLLVCGGGGGRTIPTCDLSTVSRAAFNFPGFPPLSSFASRILLVCAAAPSPCPTSSQRLAFFPFFRSPFSFGLARAR